MWSIPLMLLLKVPEQVYVLETACQSFLVVLFFFSEIRSVLKGWASFFLSSFLFADMLLDMEIAIT
jgi:hypothetical protein